MTAAPMTILDNMILQTSMLATMQLITGNHLQPLMGSNLIPMQLLMGSNTAQMQP